MSARTQADAAARHHRLSALRSQLEQVSLPALLVTARENVAYLSGFTGSAGMLLVSADQAVLLTDFRYRLQAREEAPEFEFVETERRMLDTVCAQVRARAIRRLGLEAAGVSHQTFLDVRERLPDTELIPTRDLVEGLRAVKDNTEVAAIRATAALVDRAMVIALESVRPGRTEREIMLEVESFLRREGSELLPFELIVASGPRSALPHAHPGNRRLDQGDLIVLDFGARLNGYCADLTRTTVLGQPTEHQQEVYALVAEAQKRGLAAARAGATCGEVDAAARDFLTEQGYGEQFGHGLGHGVGREVHEAPRLGRDETALLQAGMVVTIEPGIYLEGWGGVRIEDLVLVTEGGCEVLSAAPKPERLP